MLKFCGKGFTYMNTAYKLIQITNSEISDVATSENMPLGSVTRRINAPYNYCNTFVLSSSESDTVTINDPGFYKLTYSLTANAADVGVVTLDLVVNGSSVYTVSEYLGTAEQPVNITLPYTIRVMPNTCGVTTNLPTTIQFKNNGVALTGVSSNLIIEKI
jgi:hypothetical protein